MLLRGAVCLLVALVPLCLPVSGGGVFRPTPVADPGPGEPPETEVDELVSEAEGAPAAAALGAGDSSSFPRFLRPLPGEAVVPSGAARARVRELLLSFDDGPDLFGTPLVLEALERRGIKGVFFVNGRYLIGARPQDLARQDLVRKLAAHGHLVANHTLTHKNLCQEKDAVAAEVDTNSEIIAHATGLRPLLFRSPYGARCRSLDEALRQRDLLQIGWNLDPQEWKSDQDAVYRYVTSSLARLKGRAILLLHDTHPAAVRALPEILAWIDRENRRVSREGGVPIRIVDYSVFLPVRPVPPTGLEPVFQRLASSFALLPRAARASAQ